MVGVKIPNPKPGASKAARVGGLCNYIAEPEKHIDYSPEFEHTVEKCVYLGGRGFLSEKLSGRIKEMAALASEATSSPDPISHYVLSWHEGEQPTPEQIEEMVTILAKEMRVSDHQMVYGLHADTGNYHLHIALNRVHPDTLKVAHIGGGFDIEVLHKAIARIEHVQGWGREANGRYIVDAKGKVVRAKRGKEPAPDAPREPSKTAKDQEHRTGIKSAERMAIEQAAPILEAAKSWQEVHQGLAAIGMKYERQGSGAVIWVGDTPVKASAASRKTSINQMQKRLGPFEAPGEHNVYFEHKPGQKERHANDSGPYSGHTMRSLSECNLASDTGQEQKRPRVLSYNARHCRSGNDNVRRESNLPKLAPQAMPGTDPDKERYVIERELYLREKERRVKELRAKHKLEREQIKERQRMRRETILSGDWRGMGDAKNAMQSVLASEQAQERAEAQERRRLERKRLEQENPPFPDYEQWLREQGRTKEAEEWQARMARAREQEPNGFSSPADTYVPPIPPQDIRAFTPQIQNEREVVYTRQNEQTPAFVDRGQQIVVQDTQPDSTLAALQLGQAKWGEVTITGDAEFKAKCVSLAVANGIPIANPELKALVEHERQRLADVFPYSPPPPAAVAPARESEPEKAREAERQHDHVPPQQEQQTEPERPKNEYQLTSERIKLQAELDQIGRDTQGKSMAEVMDATRPIFERIGEIDRELERIAPSHHADDDPDWDIRAEAAAQAHDDDMPPPAPAPAPEPEKAKPLSERLEDKRDELALSIEALAKREMPFDERYKQTQQITAQITELERQINKAKLFESMVISGRTDKSVSNLKLGDHPVSVGPRQYILATDAAGKEHYLPYHQSIAHLHGKSVDVQIKDGKFSVSEIKTHDNAMNKPTPPTAPTQQTAKQGNTGPVVKKGMSM